MEQTPSDSAARQALRSVADVFAASGGVLFELPHPTDSAFQITAALDQSTSRLQDLTVSKGSLLPRWLRVNASVLPLPDSVGVFNALPVAEQNVLRTLHSELAVPLIHDDELVAWVSLNAVQSPPLRPGQIDSHILEAAAQLGAVRKTARERASAEVALRSNRLSVAGQMAAGIAHEVRNPLAAVRSMVQLVRSETAPVADRHRLLDNVVAEVDRVNRVLTGMMALGRPTAARDERSDLATVAADAVNFCQAYAKQHGQIIRAMLPESLWVQGDPYELRQVMVNLLLNACQASITGQTIVVDGASKSDVGGKPQVVVRIMDTGEGMPRHVLDRVFEPFFSTKQDGGGLGLSICRDAVQRHGGNITIASEPKVGTVVSVELPQVPHDANSGR